MNWKYFKDKTQPPRDKYLLVYYENGPLDKGYLIVVENGNGTHKLENINDNRNFEFIKWCEIDD